MAQLHPGSPSTMGEFHTLAYAALEEQAQEMPQSEIRSK
jgi:hypothetical protein